MGMRNYCVGYFNETSQNLNYWIQVEERVGITGTKGYLIEVPRLQFGKTGRDLYSRDVKQHLLLSLPSSLKSSSSPSPSSSKISSLSTIVVYRLNLCRQWWKRRGNLLSVLSCYR